MVFFCLKRENMEDAWTYSICFAKRDVCFDIEKKNDMKVQTVESEKSSYGGHKETMKFSFIFETKMQSSLLISVENLALPKLTERLMTKDIT